jgi:hypothetical protein
MFLIMAAICVSRASQANDISGVYISKTSNAVRFLQLAQSDKSKLEGRYEEVIIKNNGDINDNSYVFSGSVNDKNIVGTIASNGILKSTVAVSGTISGDNLHLSGGPDLNIDLVSGREVDFKHAVMQLRQHAMNIKVELDEESQLGKIADVTKRLTVFNNSSRNNFAIFSDADIKYRRVTQQMRDLLAGEQAITGSGQRSVARGQISVAIYQKSNEAAQTHVGMASFYDQFSASVKRIAADSNDIKGMCGVKQNFLLGQWSQKCATFNEVYADYVQIRDSHQKHFIESESVWNLENKAQDAIKHDSEVAIN